MKQESADKAGPVQRRVTDVNASKDTIILRLLPSKKQEQQGLNNERIYAFLDKLAIL